MIQEIIQQIWVTLTEMAPYLLFGFAVAGILHVLVSPAFVERHLGGRGLWGVLKACLFGIPLPLCSCGVIPVAASLRRHGAGRGATTAFLIATPQTGVDSILVTYSLLGLVFAICRPVMALVSGFVGGVLVNTFDHDDAPASNGEGAAKGATPRGSVVGMRGRFVDAVRYGFGDLPRDIAKPLIVGILMAGVIGAFVPDTLVQSTIGTGIGAMLIMMAVGIPLYVCATASVPIAAALIMKGVTPGAALVFLMTGPATNAAAITTIWKVMGRRTALIYLLSVAVTALACGMLLDAVLPREMVVMAHGRHEMLSPAVGSASAIALLLILVIAMVGPYLGRCARETAGAAVALTEQTVLRVEGMTCSHCAESVRTALRECPGVTSADVDLQKGRAVVDGRGLSVERLVQAVQAIGYEADALPR